MNLNKQAKLFSQGMHPVVKYGSNGKWERIKEKPTFFVTEENFVLSFFHRTSSNGSQENNADNLTYYAFTFPWTYEDQMEALRVYDDKYEKSPEELEIFIRELNGPRKDKLVININETVNQDFTTDEDMLLDVGTEDANSEIPVHESSHETLERPSTQIVDENTSESMQHLSSLVNNVKIEKTSPETVLAYIAQDIRSRRDEAKDDIYYYRELLINSYEQRRIDLLTITSFHGIEDRHENRLKNCFPDHSKPRCHTFKDKKVIFISSRVHPGETPASFVLNGFLNLLLDRKNSLAIILRFVWILLKTETFHE